jgi:hypothetical protein
MHVFRGTCCKYGSYSSLIRLNLSIPNSRIAGGRILYAQGHSIFAIEEEELTLPFAWTSDEADFTDE